MRKADLVHLFFKYEVIKNNGKRLLVYNIKYIFRIH